MQVGKGNIFCKLSDKSSVITVDIALLILHRTSSSGGFLKASCNAQSEITFISFVICYINLHLSYCALNGSLPTNDSVTHIGYLENRAFDETTSIQHKCFMHTSHFVI